MNNEWDEMREALQTARNVDNAASYHAKQMGMLLARNGNIKRLNHDELCTLKKQLADYNMNTGTWKK